MNSEIAARGCWRAWPKLLRPESDGNPGGEGPNGERQNDESPAAAQARRPRRSRSGEQPSGAEGDRRPRGHPRARLLVQLSRRVHRARHAGDQGAAAGRHRPRHGGRDRGARSRRDGPEDRRPRAGQPAQQEERADGRDDGRRHGGILPRRRRPAHRYAAGRELRAGGVAAGRLRHRAPHARHP